jgi:Caspase domain
MRKVLVLAILVSNIFCNNARAANRRAILIGISTYNSGNISKPSSATVSRKALSQGDVRYWEYRDLNGPVADVALIEGLLKSADFGFTDADIVELLNGDATAQAILATLQSELVDHTSAGDVRFVYYSGHGNYIKNLASKERDQLDQTIVPVDNRFGVIDVRDKELSRIFWAAAKKGVVVTFVADSCHSGSLARGPGNGRVVRSNSGIRSSGSGVNFLEPIVNDPANIDPQDHKPIDPEDLGVLTLAAAERNQESIEQRFTGDSTHQVHGALTFALIRALQSEGPHASMNMILDRVLNFLSAEKLQQVPVLGGKGRGERDILGQPVSPSSFSVSVEEIRGKDIILRGGQAIGIYSGCELKKLSIRPGDAELTLTVVDSQNLAESTAQVSKGTGQVAIGDRFEVTRWAVPPESILRVYIPPPADASVVHWITQNLSQLATDGSFKWVSDPTEENLTDIVRWNGRSWILEHIQSTTSTIDLGTSPTAADIRARVTNQSRLFVLLPPTPELISKIELGSGTRSAIEKLTTGYFSDADYGLFGRLQGTTVQYAWVAADGEVHSKQLRATESNASGQGVSSSLPNRTDWYNSSSSVDELGASLTESATRLGTVRAWLTLEGRPGQTIFPYDLVLRKMGSSTNVTRGTLVEGEKYKLYLNIRSDFGKPSVHRRWVYVFDINQNAKATLIYPEPGKGNEGNHLPLSKEEKDSSAAAKNLIPLYTDKPFDFEVSEPFGTDTFVLLTSDRAIDHPEIFEFTGVKTKGPAYRDDLENLLANVGSSERGVETKKSPGKWSVERRVYTSISK